MRTMAEMLVFLFSKNANQLESISIYYFARKLIVFFWLGLEFDCGPWLAEGQ
jgi:hypothetical protein